MSTYASPTATALSPTQLRSLLLRHRREHWDGIQPDHVQERVVEDMLQSGCETLLQAVASHFQIHPGQTVLDVGSGVGSFVTGCRSRGFRAFGVEPDRIGKGGTLTAIQIARQRVADDVFVAGVGERLPFADESFDLVTLNQVIEHVSDQAAVLREATRVVKPGGAVYVACPNYLRFYEPHYKIFWLPLMPKWLGRWYLRLRGRNPVMIEQITYTTNRRLRALLDHLGPGYQVIDLNREEFLRTQRTGGFVSKRARLVNKLAGIRPFGPPILRAVAWWMGLREGGCGMLALKLPVPDRTQ